MNTTYIQALIEHTNEHFEALQELSVAINDGKHLSFHERNSAERSMQIVIEACIGLSKHICKKTGKQVLGEASTNATKALDILATKVITPVELKGAIGMRNAIVHDYLNLDWQLVEAVLVQQDYQKLKLFIQVSTSFLQR